MRIPRAAVVMVTALITLACAPAAAQAACPAPAPAAAELGRAAGDDPAITPPADPTCDGGGYDAEFPDAPLVSDATTVPAATGGGFVPTGSLPVTGVSDQRLQLALLLFIGGALMIQGALIHRAFANEAR